MVYVLIIKKGEFCTTWDSITNLIVLAARSSYIVERSSDNNRGQVNSSDTAGDVSDTATLFRNAGSGIKRYRTMKTEVRIRTHDGTNYPTATTAAAGNVASGMDSQVRIFFGRDKDTLEQAEFRELEIGKACFKPSNPLVSYRATKPFNTSRTIQKNHVLRQQQLCNLYAKTKRTNQFLDPESFFYLLVDPYILSFGKLASYPPAELCNRHSYEETNHTIRITTTESLIHEQLSALYPEREEHIQGLYLAYIPAWLEPPAVPEYPYKYEYEEVALAISVILHT
ncbi:hypothetical protein OEA41_005544 [Lepraria neglecta]|uniref:Uncharacterized protein n=1 Tax=Lepraria neglecta TaxID=209136 RepID=A0AAE0DQI8_9LECA|nr:hypothetical protein OEA41_005544 [Lepraria neglecta]